MGIQVGVGVKPGSVGRITEQGNIVQSGNPYDIAISGRGYLQVLLPSGETAFTRAGNLSISAEGQLVTSDGYTVDPAVTIPAGTTAVTISSDGVVSATPSGSTTPTQVGQIELASFVNPAGLDAQGDNLFKETAASGAPTSATPGTDGLGTIMQGFLETSNVNAVEEISALIVAQRAYEMNAKVITASDEMLQTTSQLR
jgi:flagellar basal-body rod protein FlgG